ncbi:putative nuclear mrna splicing factor-associated protein [Podospora australis]|uniref:Nuclear mrna splicing factor-associated protein n=1 Tax=Podospora australis TaxID=1536484 RepID=A0AAN7AG80_9PEZI|nr:putative nuclear mrna splicing factor-associated protein [Podospora australis]
MSKTLLITFKAGKCDFDESSPKPWKVQCDLTPGYVYLYSEDELVHFCWRPRSADINDESNLDLTMIPGDASFVPYDTRTPKAAGAKTNARIFVLKFSSSSQRHIFWLQSKAQGRSGDPAWLSPRDKKVGEIVDQLLQGEEVDVNAELASVRNNNDDGGDARRDADDDETMEDVEGHGDPHSHHQGTGGAGPGATGGDFRQEGEDSRDGGADGARAASNNLNSDAMRLLIESLSSNPAFHNKGGAAGGQSAQGKLYPLLNDLLETSTTIPMLDNASDEYVDNLLSYLPPTVLVLTQQGDNGDAIPKEPSSESVEAAKQAMSSPQKRALLKKVLRSPQFSQSLASLTSALRDGGLPTVSEALGIAVENGGRVKGGSVPLGGGEAVEAFVEGVKKTDERISYSKLDNKYIAVQEDGTEFEFDEGLKRWIPIIDEALIEQQQRAYMMPGADDDDDDSSATQGQGRKRKMDHSNDREQDSSENKRNGRKKPQRPPQQPKQNTAVYVTNLPLDATVEEVAELFSKKCGVIAEEIDSGRPRIKMYTDSAGNFKGDALVVFFKPQSVDMAIMLLDDTDFRFSPSGLSSGKMRVQAAEMSYKKTKYDDSENNNNGNKKKNTVDTGAAGDDEEQKAAQKQEANKQRSQDKAKIIRKTQKLSAKLADWSDDEPSAIYNTAAEKIQPKGGKWDKVVILRHMFTLEELEEDPAALLDIKDDIREECAKLGPVTNVVLYDLEEEGIVSVKFQTREAAEACLQLMHGRSFAGQTVEAFFATGREKFRKSKDKDDGGKDSSDGDSD